jgi:hypothetical protein
MGMTSDWVTIGVGALAAVASLVGALGGQWLSSSRAMRLAESEREAKRANQDRQERRMAYVRFLTAARLIGPAVRTVDRAALDSALVQLREASTEVELANALLWDEHVAALIEVAQRWVSAALKDGPTGPATQEPEMDYRTALNAVRERMQVDLGSR